MSKDYVAPPLSFQQLIREAGESKLGEADRSMDLRIEIRTHGKPSHLWKIALRLSRHIHVIFGDSVKFFTPKNEELLDDLSDDDGEYWHSLEWKEGEAIRPISKVEEDARALLRRAGVGELGG